MLLLIHLIVCAAVWKSNPAEILALSPQNGDLIAVSSLDRRYSVLISRLPGNERIIT
jgi:hypothetical protein